jgi:hypothetical protein
VGPAANEEPALPQRLAFVVQLSADEAARGRFAGRVSHVVSTRSARFASVDECLAFIDGVLRAERPKEA